ncbi:MAG: hypothetical protein A2538_02235 [Candidatus Magasanikbacteria bacterium RIFOXYD2_FULL_41_14]|uniref:Uncharacterized protein n=1 Tax=Candidatus Magasanikbacteria bacterium RIFOXYD2_FULL_41_14 TaxID=1798709 RepID=A0A1F6PCX5_9BACT|nr:MAG: hypothetical protein A2538_02235 [Candidatus Magasanikbacteria bacterium RIFOXYD2_FULL_41_14]
MVSNPTNKWKKIFWSRWFLFAAFVLATASAVAFGRAYFQDYQVRQDIVRLQDGKKQLQAKKINTDELLQYVKSDDFIQEKAHLELNLVKPGEQVAIVDSAENFNRQENQFVVQSINNFNPVKWWRFFTHQLAE